MSPSQIEASAEPRGLLTRFAIENRRLRLVSSAVLDQAILSATNFVVGFVLIRFATDQDYGLYVLVQSALLLAVTIHNAWLSGPLAILVPRLSALERRGTITAIKLQQRRWLRWIALPLLIVPAGGYLVANLSGAVAFVVAFAICAGWMALRREYLRSVLLIYGRPHSLLGADAAYAIALLLGAGAAILFGHYVIVFATAALVLAAYVGGFAADRSLNSDPGWSEEQATRLWPDIRRLGFWSMVGAGIYWFLGQSYSYMLATRLDLHAVADVSATRLLLNPAFILTIGVVSLLNPSAARWYAQLGPTRMMRRLITILVLLACAESLYFLVVWLSRHWIIDDLLHKQIHDRDRLLLLWAGVALMSVLRDVLQCALIAMGQLKLLAWQVGVSALIAVAVMWWGMPVWGAAAVLIGQIIGETVNLGGIIYSLRRSLQSTHHPVVAGAGQD